MLDKFHVWWMCLHVVKARHDQYQYNFWYSKYQHAMAMMMLTSGGKLPANDHRPGQFWLIRPPPCHRLSPLPNKYHQKYPKSCFKTPLYCSMCPIMSNICKHLMEKYLCQVVKFDLWYGKVIMELYVILSSYHFMGWMGNLVLKENDYYEVKLWENYWFKGWQVGTVGTALKWAIGWRVRHWAGLI